MTPFHLLLFHILLLPVLTLSLHPSQPRPTFSEGGILEGGILEAAAAWQVACNKMAHHYSCIYRCTYCCTLYYPHPHVTTLLTTHLTTHLNITTNVTTKPSLCNTVSSDGTTPLSLGGTLTITPGTYAAGMAHDETDIFLLNGVTGRMECEEVLECTLDGEGGEGSCRRIV